MRPNRPTRYGMAVLVACVLMGVVSPARARHRAARHSNAPIGVNFLIVGYAYTRGGLSFDSAVPISNANLNTSNAVLAYARVLDGWGQSAKLALE